MILFRNRMMVFLLALTFCFLQDKSRVVIAERPEIGASSLVFTQKGYIIKDVNHQLRKMLLKNPALAAEVDRVVESSPFLQQKKRQFLQEYYRNSKYGPLLFRDMLYYQNSKKKRNMK